jgi:transposase
MRMALIDMVELEDCTISVAAKELGIKLSTAKLIVSRFRKTGTFFKRKRERTEEKE